MKRTSRRQVLAGITTATATVGCSSDSLDRYDDVSISNSTAGRKAGSVTVVDPTETVVLDESFTLLGDNSLIGYEHVLTRPGAYLVGIELTDGTGSPRETRETVNVAEPRVGQINAEIKGPTDGSLTIEISLEQHTRVGEWG